MRERGIERTSLIDLMRTAGLTHGGFYRHFKSKDELVALSASKAFEEVADRFDKGTGESGPKAALMAYVLEYLSEVHRYDPGMGCMISACGADASRQSGIVRKAFTIGISKLLDLRPKDCPAQT